MLEAPEKLFLHQNPGHHSLLQGHPWTSSGRHKGPDVIPCACNQQVTSAAAWAALCTMASPVFAVAAIVAAPLSMVAFGALLAAGSVAFKWGVAGAVKPGVHR